MVKKKCECEFEASTYSSGGLAKIETCEKHATPKLCSERGYHSWAPNGKPSVDSCGESYYDMSLTAHCAECGAVWEGRGDWNVEDVEEEED